VQLLRWNHKTYTEFAKETWEQFKSNRGREDHFLNSLITPQPSYKTYMYYTDEGMRVIVSPAILASGGVLETCNVEVDRGPENISLFTEEELKDYYDTFKSTFLSSLY
jgi:hypothetical protein